MGEEKKKKATKEGEATATVVKTEPTTVEEPTLTREDIQKEIDMCNTELAQVLEKYQCKLTAQLIINEENVVPQIFTKSVRRIK